MKNFDKWRENVILQPIEDAKFIRLLKNEAKSLRK